MKRLTMDLLKGNITRRFTYEQVREKSKISGVAAFFILFKSCVGLGVFSYPYAFGKVGYFWGVVLGIYICYITTYGMYRISTISSDIEKRMQGLVIINDYHHLAHYVTDKYKGPKWAFWFSLAAIVGTILNNVSVVISSVIEISVHLKEWMGLSGIYVKLIIIFLYLVVTTYALEPEKLKVFGVASGAFVIITVGLMYYDNTRLTFPDAQTSDVRVEAMNIKNTGIFMGMAGFAYEAAGTIFTVRLTMQDRHAMPQLIIYVFIFVGYVFSVFSLSFYLAYGAEGLKPIAFEFYLRAVKPFMYYMGVAFCVSLIPFVPIFNIASSELIEQFGFFKSIFKDPSGTTRRVPLLLFRYLLFVVSCSPALITDKIELVMNLGGSLIIPVISFFIPVLLHYMHRKNFELPFNPWIMLHDGFIFCSGILVLVLGVMYSINDITKDKEHD